MNTTPTKPIKVGDKLANGATVLAARPTKFHGGLVLLCLWRDEFVTWVARS